MAGAGNSENYNMLSGTALPLIDQEYDIPEYKQYVDYMIAEELKVSTEPEVNLSQRFSSLWSDEELNACLKRIEERGLLTQPKVDKARCQKVQQPPAGKDKDNVDAWKHSLDQVKTQLMYQENELTGMDLLLHAYSEESPFFSQLQRQETRYLSALASLDSYYTHEDQALSRQLVDAQKSRQNIQHKAHPALYKYWQRKNTAYVSRAQVETAYHALHDQLRERGFDYDADLQQEEAEKFANERRSHTENNTVKEYETVNVHEQTENNDNDQGRGTTKKRANTEKTSDGHETHVKKSRLV